jgi:hypothetical protein
VLSVVRGDDCETVSAAKLGLEVKLLVRARRVELGPELIVRLMRRGLPCGLLENLNPLDPAYGGSS